MNRNTFQTDRRRAWQSRGFAACAIGVAAAAFFGVFDQMLPVFQGQYQEMGLEKGFALGLASSAFSSELMHLALPVLCALPFAAAFLEDYRSRFWRFCLLRSGTEDYVRVRAAVTALAGGLSLLAGMAFAVFLFLLLFVPWETASGEAGSLAACLTKGFLFFLSGCFWSLVGGIMATATMNRYMAYASPFIFYYLLVILSERYFRGIYMMDPREWVNPQSDWVGGFWGAALWTAELTAGAMVLYRFMMERRLRNV
ncbi:MAG: hypothetical protein ACOX8H_11270 [Ruminococcus sp.]